MSDAYSNSYTHFVFPQLAAAFVGLKPVSAKGISEMRATLGSFFLGLGIARLLSIFIDRSFSIKNLGGVFTEAILGAMLLLGGNWS